MYRTLRHYWDKSKVYQLWHMIGELDEVLSKINVLTARRDELQKQIDDFNKKELEYPK